MVLLAKIVLNQPCNHWSYDIRHLWPLPLASLLWAGLARLFGTVPRRLMFLVGVCSIVFGICLFVLDCFNVLIEYEEWMQRGMPDMWEFRRW